MSRCCTSEMGLQIFLKFCNVMRHGVEFPVVAQLGNDVRFVLILIATDNHQTILCSWKDMES